MLNGPLWLMLGTHVPGRTAVKSLPSSYCTCLLTHRRHKATPLKRNSDRALRIGRGSFENSSKMLHGLHGLHVSPVWKNVRCVSLEDIVHC